MVAQASEINPANGQFERLRVAFEQQRQAFLADPWTDAATRRAQLARLIDAVVRHQDELAECVSADYGHRAAAETRAAEILVVLQAARYARRRLGRWMHPDRRSTGLLMASTRASVKYQPLGVVGIIAPWNYPLQLSLVPLVYALAAGNRVIIKPSELTPRTGEILERMLQETFSADRVAVVRGDAALGPAFSATAFDHLIFTGSTATGRHVMRAAAENLTPVTLELGGKTPTIVSASANIDLAAERIVFGKSLNAGQSCVAPDHILCAEPVLEELCAKLKIHFERLYPEGTSSPDYSCLIDRRQTERMRAMLADARAKGARVDALGAGADVNSVDGKLPLTMVHNITDDMQVMQQEVFGPLLPVLVYRDFGEVLQRIALGPRPLAINYFGRDRKERDRIERETHSGGLCINDAVFHVAVDDLPFGGVGESGMGRYHGHEGFLALSNARAVFERPWLNTARVFYPPYGGRLAKWLLRLFLPRG